MDSNEHTQFLKSSEHFRNIWRNGKVAVVDSISSFLARDAGHYLSQEGVRSALIDSNDPSWYRLACAAECTHYLFLSQPETICRPLVPKRADLQSEDYAFFRECSITKAVVVVNRFPSKKTSDIPLADRFLKLERQDRTIEWLATAALVMFSVPSPSSFPDDCAYWSKEPKLITLWKKSPDASLGFSIMTRQMSDDSVFKKVVLVKRFTDKSIESSIGKFGHIQSINGELLDGLSIDMATQRFKSSQLSFVQLIVRFVHPLKHSPVQRPGTLPIEKSDTVSVTSTSDPRPFPLFIFGDNHTACRHLTHLLSVPEKELSALSLATPSSVSSTTGLLSLNSPRSSEDGDKTLTSGDGGDKGLASNAEGLWHPSVSDNCMDRQEVSPPGCLGEQDGDMLDAGTMEGTTTPRQQPASRSISSCQFIVQTLKDASSKRSFAHLFMKSVGLYLVVVDLEDAAYDPLIQYENMLYWLNLIHTYVRPSNLERILIVGLYKHSELEENVQKVSHCLDLFNVALEKTTSYLGQIYHFTNQQKKMFIFEFDQDNSRHCTKELWGHIFRCQEILIKRASIFEAEFCTVMCQPSPHFHSACTKLMSVAKQRPFVPDVNAYIDPACPHAQRSHLVHTLAAYAPVWIDDESNACLLCPHVAVELVKSFMEVEEAVRVFKDELTFRYHLPILNYPFVKKKIIDKGLEKEAEQTKLLACLKKFHFIFSIGTTSDPNKQRFLVPYLATEECAEQGTFQQWDPQYVRKNFGSPGCTTLYAELRFAGTLQFFHSVLAVLLAQLLNHPPAGRDYRNLIKLGCKQAVLCLNHEAEEHEVLIKFHPIQSIIEFRLAVSVKTREHWLLKGVNGCLLAASVNGNFPIEYCIPLSQQEVSGLGTAALPLHNLKKLTGDDKSVSEDDATDDLLNFKYLGVHTSSPININFKNNIEFRTWASSDPEAKELSAELFEEVAKELGSSDAWKRLAIQLGVLETKDLNLWTHNPHKYGNGHIVLSKWKESGCTWQQLVQALNRIDHQRLAGKVENAFKNYV